MKQVFVADDGSQFETSADCEAYEALAGRRETISKWAETRYGAKQGQAMQAENKVTQWEMDREAVLSGKFEFKVWPKKPKKGEEDAALAEAA